MRHINIPVFIPHLGCPNECVFCNQRAITGTGPHMSVSFARERIEAALLTVKKEGAYVEIAFFGGSFSGIDENDQEQYLSLASRFVTEGTADGIRLSTRPDLIDGRVVERFMRFGVTAVELGVQSMCDDVLTLSRRGHSAADVYRAVELLSNTPIELGLQMMAGLPGDTRERCVETARAIAALRPDTARLYPALVLKGTTLYNMYKSGEYLPLSIDEAVDWCAAALPVLRGAGIRVLRCGIMSSWEMERGDLAAGPYHPAFGELVAARIMQDEIEEALSQRRAVGGTLEVLVNGRDLSKMTGNGGRSLKELCRRFSLDKATALAHPSVERGAFELIYKREGETHYGA